MKKKLEKAYRQGRFREDGYPDDWRFRLCTARLMLGDLSWRDWEFRDPWALMLWYNERELGKPRWRGEPGKVLVLGEQGLGDEIMFASCIPDLQKTNEIGITCAPRLVSVFSRAFKCPVFDRNEGKELSRARELLKDYDYYVGLGDLPRHFRKSAGDFPKTPYLVPDPQRVAEMEPYRGKVGVSWRGRNGYYRFEDFPKGVSLQYDINWDEDPELPHVDCRDDIEGVFALISVLSKVVCVSTTVAHIAGALGTPLDVILAPYPTARSGNQINWRWGKNWWYRAQVHETLELYKRGLR